MTSSKASTQGLQELGAEVALVDALDAAAGETAIRKSGAEAVIDELTSLPRSPGEMGGGQTTDGRLRIEGGGNLRRAALACGVHRYIQQSSGFFLAPGEGLADESVGMAVDASPGVAFHARSYAELEARVLAPGPLEGVALRYGVFYGRGPWYSPEGAGAGPAPRQE